MTNRWENSLKAPYTFFMTFLLGWSGYSFKLVSVIKLIEELSLSYLPLLMIAQGIFLYFNLTLVQKLRLKFPKFNFYFFYIIFSLIVFSSGYTPIVAFFKSKGLSIYFSIGLYLISFLGGSICEILVKEIQAKNLSVLKNPHQAGQLTMLFEVGILIAAIGTIAITGELGTKILSFWNTLPFVMSFISYGAFHLISTDRNQAIVLPLLKVTPEDSKEVNSFYYPFVPYLLVVVTLLFISKNIQGYATLVGMLEWKKSGDESIAMIFSKFNIIQTILIFAALIPSFFKQKRNPNWARGLNAYFIFQACSMGILCLYSPVFLLMGTGVLRKIIHHSIVLKSIQQLESSIPMEVRSRVKILQESFGQGGAYVISGCLLAMILNGPVPAMIVWSFGLVVAISGIVYRKKLLATLNEFQVANLVKTDVYQAMSSLYGLACRESSKHYMALVNLLESNPRPLLAKALIYSLGKMEKVNSIPYIISYYKKHDREDVHQEIINSLDCFKGHKINLFFTKCLQDLILKQTSLGELRVSVFKSLSKRIKDVALLTLLKILEENKSNPPVLANAIILLGEMAKEYHDKEVYSILADFLDAKYARRVRVNAILYLYHSQEHSQAALEALDTFLTSSEIYDRTSVAFVAGNLQLKGLLPFIIKSSEELEHKNSTLLVSLLKLNYKKAAAPLGQFLMSSDEKESLTALNQFNTIKNSLMRYLVYDWIILNFPSELKRFNLLLRKSHRNFDADRQVINSEAKRLGLVFEENSTIYQIEESVSSDPENSEKEAVENLKAA